MLLLSPDRSLRHPIRAEKISRLKKQTRNQKVSVYIGDTQAQSESMQNKVIPFPVKPRPRPRVGDIQIELDALHQALDENDDGAVATFLLAVSKKVSNHKILEQGIHAGFYENLVLQHPQSTSKALVKYQLILAYRYAVNDGDCPEWLIEKITDLMNGESLSLANQATEVALAINEYTPHTIPGIQPEEEWYTGQLREIFANNDHARLLPLLTSLEKTRKQMTGTASELELVWNNLEYCAMACLQEKLKTMGYIELDRQIKTEGAVANSLIHVLEMLARQPEGLKEGTLRFLMMVKNSGNWVKYLTVQHDNNLA